MKIPNSLLGEDIDNPVETNGKKYPALRIIVTFYKVLAYAVVFAAFMFFIFSFKDTKRTFSKKIKSPISTKIQKQRGYAPLPTL